MKKSRTNISYLRRRGGLWLLIVAFVFSTVLSVVSSIAASARPAQDGPTAPGSADLYGLMDLVYNKAVYVPEAADAPKVLDVPRSTIRFSTDTSQTCSYPGQPDVTAPEIQVPPSDGTAVISGSYWQFIDANNAVSTDINAIKQAGCRRLQLPLAINTHGASSPFVLSTDQATLYVGANATTFAAQHVPASAGGYKMWTNGPLTNCPSAVVNDGGQWFIFPMTTKSSAPTAEASIVSESYDKYLSGLTGAPEATLAQACSTDSAQIATDFNLAGFWTFTEVHEQVQATDNFMSANGYCSPTRSTDNLKVAVTGVADLAPDHSNTANFNPCTLEQASSNYWDSGTHIDSSDTGNRQTVFRIGTPISGNTNACNFGGKNYKINDHVFDYLCTANHLVTQVKDNSRTKGLINFRANIGTKLTAQDNYVWSTPGLNLVDLTPINGDDGYLIANANQYPVLLPPGAPAPTVGKLSTGATPPDTSKASSSQPTCQGGAMGWILCPAIDYVRQVTSAVANILSSLLQLQPFTPSSYGGAPYITWDNIRNIANVAFVIAFMVIVFSQATSVGISSYGVKKLLPRLIATAILVNISFFLCAVLVDISNLLGTSIGNLFAGVAGASGGGGSIGSQVANTVIGNKFIDGALLVAGGVVLVLFFFVPTLIAILATLFVLGFREAAVILLMAASPFAAVAYLLPNTEKWSKRWWGAFAGMLFLYPSVMAIFSAASMAATIIASQKFQTTGGVPSAITNVIPALIALIIQALPLIALPAIFKLSLGALATIQARATGILNKAGGDKLHGAARGALKRQALDTEARMAARGGVLGAVGNFRARRGFKQEVRQSDVGHRQQEALAGYIEGNDSLRGSRTGQALLDKHEQEQIGLAQRALQRQGVFNPQALAAVALDKTQSEATRRAAMRSVISAGDSDALNRMFMEEGDHHGMLVSEVQQQYPTAKAAGAHFVKLAAEHETAPGVTRSNYTAAEIQQKAAASLADLSFDKLAAQDTGSVKAAADGFNTASVEARQKLQASAQAILSNPTILAGAKAGVREALEDIATRPINPSPAPTPGGGTPTPPPATP